MENWQNACEIMENSGLLLANETLLSCSQISTLNLSNTELVILSACQSGKSLFHSSEGVFGLRRAFKLAGCHTILATLWHVEDRSCSIFMQLFYRELLEKEFPVSTAFHNAVKELKNCKENGICIYTNPYFWAGYILII